MEAAWRIVIVEDQTAFGRRNNTKAIERTRRHKEELVDKTLLAIHDMEHCYEISERWTADSPQWKRAEELLKNRTYRRCLDALEGLIVARMFELTKMNMSQTSMFIFPANVGLHHVGYKQRKHIAKALQARSQAIHTALDKYNTAARILHKPELCWNEVVKYLFLSEFDLRDTRQDVRTRLWATHAGCLAMDRYYKIQGAHHEIARLNTEIQRLLTNMRDDELYLQHHIERLATRDPLLAHQLDLHWLDRI